MYGYGYRYNSGLVVSAGGGAPFVNTYSLSFDGVDDFVGVDTIGFLNNATTLSFSGWVKKTSGNAVGFESYIGATNRIILYWWTNNIVYFGVRNGSTSPAASSSLTIYDWNHIAGTFDGATNTIKLYINGVLADTQTGQPSSTSANVGSNFKIGISNGSTYNNGNIDEVSLYDKVLTQEEITSISAAPTDLTSLNPIAWYRNGDNGAWKSPQWLLPNNENKDKVSNYSFQLDGVDDYVNIPNNTDLNFSSAYSVSFWINTTSTALLSPISNQSKFLIRLYAPANQIRLQLYDGSNGFLNLDNTQVFNDGQWHHIAFTTEATTTADKVIVYFDGVALSNKGTQTNVGSHLSAFAYEIGRNSGTWNFNGNIDEVSLYDSELSASQISDIYNGGEPTTISGAVAHYKMGEDATFSGGVWTVPDAVGSNNGTSNGMTIEDRIGEAPNSASNSVSYNMDEVDRVEDTP
jgi:hypothetical protein